MNVNWSWTYEFAQMHAAESIASALQFDPIWSLIPLVIPRCYILLFCIYLLLCIIVCIICTIVWLYIPWPRLLHLNNLGEGHSALYNCDHLPSLPKQWWKSHRRLVCPNCGSSVRRTNGCVGMTGCTYTYVSTTMQCKHLWFQKQTERLQSMAVSHPNTSISMPHWGATIREIQLSVALLSIVWDDWGGDHWFPVNSKKWPFPPGCSALIQCSSLVQGRITSD